jgi:hypothetical protein
LVIMAVSGAAGVVVATGRRPVLAGVLGALGGVGCVLSIPLYVELRARLSHTMFSFEVLIPAAMVGLPLMAVWQAVEARASERRSR